MLLWMSLAARLAPLLLMTSAVLVAMRYLHDRLGKAAAVVVLVLGLAIVVPYAARMGLIVGIRHAVNEAEWPVVSERIEVYRRLGGKLDGHLLYARAMALANEGQVAEALPDFAAAARSGDPLVSRSSAVLQTGLCLYALRRYDEAKQVLVTLPESGTRDYLLGRIAEQRADPNAEGWFRHSLAVDPSFQPALYRLLRILSMRRDVNGALAVLHDYRRANRQEAGAPYLQAMEDAIRRGEVLVDYEPFRLQS